MAALMYRKSEKNRRMDKIFQSPFSGDVDCESSASTNGRGADELSFQSPFSGDLDCEVAAGKILDDLDFDFQSPFSGDVDCEQKTK